MGLLTLSAIGVTAVALSGWNIGGGGGTSGILPGADAALFNAIVPNLSSGWFAKPGPSESILFGLVVLKVMAMRMAGLFPYNLNELWEENGLFENGLNGLDIDKIWRRMSSSKKKNGSRVQRDVFFAKLNKFSKAPLLKEIAAVERILLHGNTCLHEASWRGYSRLVKVLSNKQTVDRQNHGGFTALHLACQAGHNQSTRELLMAGADPNLVNTYGDTALHTAVRYGHAGVARILLSARAGPDIQNKNGDTPLHIASAMGRKKLTKILLSVGCRLNLKNHQRETALDIGIRKSYEEICQMLQNPPEVITPIQRDELRASKYNNSKSASSSGSKSKSEGGKAVGGKRRDLSVERRSGGGSSGTRSHHTKRDKSGGGSSKGRSSSKDSPSQSRSSNNDVLPNWSPYGCHYHPNPQAFPPPNIDSLPEEPLSTGELYYLDLAGNIHKGPIGISEGCYCTPILQPTTSVVDSPAVQCAKNCQEQLRTLTTQLSKIHLDTQAQLSSLQSMLNEKLPQKESCHKNSAETQLKDWVKQYRRFRKELSKNPKALIQANELLERASTLMVTRPASPCAEEEESDSDSGL